MLQCQRPPRRKREPIRYPEGVGGREVCNLKTADGMRIYVARKYEMRLRQQNRCAICHEFMEWWNFQFDHEKPRGGGNRDDRIEVNGQWKNAALCGNCNSLKGSKRYTWHNGLYIPVVKEVA